MKPVKKPLNKRGNCQIKLKLKHYGKKKNRSRKEKS